MDQDLAQVDAAALTDAKQLRLTSGRVLPWHDPQPCSEVSPLAERSAVADSGKDGCGYHWSDPRDLSYPRASCVCARDPFQLLQHHHHPDIGCGCLRVGGIEALGLVAEQFHLTGRFWNLVGRMNENFGTLGYFIIGLFAISGIISIAIYKWRRLDRFEVNAET
jgi:hypothetical protein